HGEPPEVLQTPAFDWIAPETPNTRRLLECGRILEIGKIRRFVAGFTDKAIQHAPVSSNLDEDRLLSQALRFSHEVAKQRAPELVSSSIRLASQREKCQAHKKVPPLYVTVIQLMSEQGDIDDAVSLLQQVRSRQPSEQVVR